MDCADGFMFTEDWPDARERYQRLLDEYPEDAHADAAQQGAGKAGLAIELDRITELVAAADSISSGYCRKPAKYSQAPPTARGRTRAVFVGDTEYTDKLPEAWRTDTAHASLVVCTGEAEAGDVVETCQYRDHNGGIGSVRFNKLAVRVKGLRAADREARRRPHGAAGAASCPGIVGYFDALPSRMAVTPSNGDDAPTRRSGRWSASRPGPARSLSRGCRCGGCRCGGLPGRRREHLGTDHGTTDAILPGDPAGSASCTGGDGPRTCWRLARWSGLLREAGLAYDEFVVWKAPVSASDAHRTTTWTRRRTPGWCSCAGRCTGRRSRSCTGGSAHCVPDRGQGLRGRSALQPSPASTGSWPATAPGPARAQTCGRALRRSSRCPSSGWCSPTGSRSTRGTAAAEEVAAVLTR